MRKILFGVNLLLAACLLMSYGAAYVSPSDGWLFPFFGLTYFFWLIINALFIPVWLILKWKYAVLGMAVLFIGVPLHLRQTMFRYAQPETELASGDMRVMSYNVQLFGLYNWKENKKHRNEMFRFLRKADPDVVCFQEYFYEETDYFETTDTLVKVLDADNVHFESASSLHGTHHWGAATFSRYPIIHKGKIKFEKTKGNICLYSDIVKGKDTLRVFNVHFESNHLETEKIDRLAEGDSTARIIAMDMFRALRTSYQKRAKQVDLVRQAIEKSPYPVIVCGDFNDTPMSYTYTQISHGLKDAFLESGTGLGFTYAGKIPFLRIDYIFHDKRLTSKNFKVIKDKKLSDHYPVECIFTFEEE